MPASRRARMEAVAVAPGDKWLATGSFDGTAELWTTDGTPIRTLGRHRGAVLGVAFAPDGTWLATSDEHGPGRVWATEDGTLLYSLDTPLDQVSARGVYTGAVRAIVIAPDGEWLASGREDGLIQVWAAADGTLLHTLDGHQGGIDTLAVSVGGRWLASGGKDETLRVWSTADWTLVHALSGHAGGIRSAAFAPSGTLLAAGQKDGSVRIWDAEEGTERRTLVADEGAVRALAFSPDGQWLASGSSKGTIRIWSMATNDTESTTAIRVDDTVAGCVWSTTKSVLYAVGTRGFYRFSLHPS